MKGLSDIVSVFDSNDPEARNLNKLFSTSLSSFLVPTGVSQFAEAWTGGNLRRPRTLAENLTERTPFLSGRESLGGFKLPQALPIRDIWGREVIRPGDFWENMFSPAERMTVYTDKASTEVRRLGFAPGSPRHHLIAMLEEKTDLTNAEYDRGAQVRGEKAFEMVTGIVNSPGWDELQQNPMVNARLQRNILRKVFARASAAALAEVKPAVMERAMQSDFMRAIMGEDALLQMGDTRPLVDLEEDEFSPDLR